MKKTLRKKTTKKSKEGLYLSTGSSLLNAACSGKVDGGFLVGHYYFYVGDSNSGKTWLGHALFAEATINPAFDDYRLIYDDVEGGALMDIERFFGKKLVERLEPPEVNDDGSPVYSDTAESFYYHVADALDRGIPFIYVLDSQDSLTDKKESKKFDEDRKAHKEGREAAGSYEASKPKVHSAKLRKLMTPIERSGSILLILNQTRDSFNMFEKSSYSGGKALKFYATLQLWSSVAGPVKRVYKGKDRQIGVKAKIQVKKNRINGRDRTVTIPILHSVGIDEIGSCVDYLVSEKAWKKSKSGVITATGLGPVIEERTEKLIREIEGRGLEEDVRTMVQEVWDEIENACVVKRKSRYE